MLQVNELRSFTDLKWWHTADPLIMQIIMQVRKSLGRQEPDFGQNKSVQKTIHTW